MQILAISMYGLHGDFQKGKAKTINWTCNNYMKTWEPFQWQKSQDSVVSTVTRLQDG